MFYDFLKTEDEGFDKASDIKLKNNIENNKNIISFTYKEMKAFIDFDVAELNIHGHYYSPEEWVFNDNAMNFHKLIIDNVINKNKVADINIDNINLNLLHQYIENTFSRYDETLYNHGFEKTQYDELISLDNKILDFINKNEHILNKENKKENYGR